MISRGILFKSSSPYGIIETAVYRNHYSRAWVWEFVHVDQSSVGSMTKMGETLLFVALKPVLRESLGFVGRFFSQTSKSTK